MLLDTIVYMKQLLWQIYISNNLIYMFEIEKKTTVTQNPTTDLILIWISFHFQRGTHHLPAYRSVQAHETPQGLNLLHGMVATGRSRRYRFEWQNG